MAKKKTPKDKNAPRTNKGDDNGELNPLEAEKLPIGKSSRKALGDAIKGKNRGFVLLRKSSQILALAVYRKGPLEKHVKRVKTIGVGKIFHGVITGRGQKLEFHLCRRDGFQKEPVKKLVLREFLENQAELKTKSKMLIVDKLPKIES
jgi:hypothetical protein